MPVRAGVFVLADEVQTGLWRAGDASVALSDEYGIDPDAVLLGKPLGGGVLPLSAALCSERLYAPLSVDPFIHTTTFSGHPLACAAGLAGLDALQALTFRAVRLSALLADGLHRLAAAYSDVVVEIRGRGLLWGIELTDSGAAGIILTELSDGGLLTSPCLGRPEVIRLLPPAITTDIQLDTALSLLDAALALARAQGARQVLAHSG